MSYTFFSDREEHGSSRRLPQGNPGIERSLRRAGHQQRFGGHLEVRAASVTGMLQKLADQRPSFVKYEKHYGVRLSELGKRRALEIQRHHRLLERFLHDVLDFSWDEVHDEAERLEHYISERLEDRIAAKLGDPETDPHGHIIPEKTEWLRNGKRSPFPMALRSAGCDQQCFRPRSELACAK